MDRDLCEALCEMDAIVEDTLTEIEPDGETVEERYDALRDRLADWQRDHRAAMARAERQA